MELMDVIKKRRSVRSYKSKPIPEEKLMKVLEAARLAPSAVNRQPWKFVVVREESKRRSLAVAAANQSFVGEAPVVIAAVATSPHHVMRSGVPSYAVDLAIAVDRMTLAAADEGLGSCWIGAFDQDEVKRILKIPKNFKVVVLLPIGYPNDKPSPKPRNPLQEIICWESF